MKTRREWSRIYSGKKENAMSVLTTWTKCGPGLVGLDGGQEGQLIRNLLLIWADKWDPFV